MTRILLNVETFPDQTGHGAPLSFALHGRKFLVREIVDRWSGADHLYFKVIADDGNFYVLRHDLKENEWEMVLMETPDVHKGTKG